MAIDESALTKGQQRKLNALRKSVGEDLAEDVFEKYLKRESKSASVEKSDPVAEKLAAALSGMENDPSFRLGNQGYTVRRSRGKGASGFTVTKNDRPE